MSDSDLSSALAHPLFQQPWPEGEYRFFQIGLHRRRSAAGGGKVGYGLSGSGRFMCCRGCRPPCRYRGAESVLDVQVAVAQAGPVQIELIQQYDESPSVYRELTAAGTSLMHQCATITADYDGQTAHYASLGYELVCEVDQPSGNGSPTSTRSPTSASTSR